MAKILAAEDGNLNSSIRAVRPSAYKDFDLTLDVRSDTGDILRKDDAAAVKQAVKNLIQTNRFEKPFRPEYGAGLSDLLFDLSYGNSDHQIIDRIKAAVNRYEPRAQIMDIRTIANPDTNEVRVTTTFKVLNIGRVETIETTISRLR